MFFCMCSPMCVWLWKTSFRSHQRWRWNHRSTCTDIQGRSLACLSANPTASSLVSAKMAPVSSGTSTGKCVCVWDIFCISYCMWWENLQSSARCSICVVTQLLFVSSGSVTSKASQATKALWQRCQPARPRATSQQSATQVETALLCVLFDLFSFFFFFPRMIRCVFFSLWRK